jgi:hypothetical protein
MQGFTHQQYLMLIHHYTDYVTLLSKVSVVKKVSMSSLYNEDS